MDDLLGHYPGKTIDCATQSSYIIKFVSSTQHDLDTIISITLIIPQILSAHSYQGCLPLYLRPRDPLCAPILSHNATTTNVLIKITVPKRTGRKRKRGSNDPYAIEDDNPADLKASEGGENREQQGSSLLSHSRLDNPARLRRSLQDNVGKYQLEAVGNIIQTHRYRGLADFHYSTVSSSFMDKMRNTVLTGDLPKIREFKFDPSKGYKKNEDLFPPPVMTDHPFPFNWGYHQNSNIKVTINTAGQRVLVNQSDPAKLQTLYVSHKIDQVPAAPPLPDPINEPRLQEMIDETRIALQERPIWTRRALLNRLARPDAMYSLKKTIQYVGYQFRGGPWRDSVIKFGIDPRKDPKYSVYQTLFFKIFDETERQPGQRWTANRSEYVRAAGTSPVSHVFDGQSVYLDGKVWQICDITDPLCLKVLEHGVIMPECDVAENGWYANGTYAKLKAVMRTKISALMLGREMADSEFDDVLAFPDVLPGKKSVFVPVPNASGAPKRKKPVKGAEPEAETARPQRKRGRPSSKLVGPNRLKSEMNEVEAGPSHEGSLQILAPTPIDPRIRDAMTALNEQGGIDEMVRNRFAGEYGTGVEGGLGEGDDALTDEDDDDDGHDDINDAMDVS